jgi:hypothetical protein
VAIERVYTCVYLRGEWLKKPHVARRVIALSVIAILFSSAYELAFVKSFSVGNDNHSSMCVFEFPIASQSLWMRVHQIVSIINLISPLLINIFCTITIICVIAKNKLNLRAGARGKLLSCAFLVLSFDTSRCFKQ